MFWYLGWPVMIGMVIYPFYVGIKKVTFYFSKKGKAKRRIDLYENAYFLANDECLKAIQRYRENPTDENRIILNEKNAKRESASKRYDVEKNRE